MDELTLLSDAHRVDPPAADLIQRERAALDTLVASAGGGPSARATRRWRRAGHEVPAAARAGAGVDRPAEVVGERDRRGLAGAGAGRRRRVRRTLLAGALGAGVLAGVGTAAAVGLLDRHSAEMVDSTDCGISSDDARLVASAVDSRGSTIEYWRIETPGGGVGDLVAEKLPDGSWAGGMLGCDTAERHTARDDTAQPWAVVPYSSDAEATLLDLYGWVPVPATTAVVSLSDGTSVTVEVSPEGFFLQPITRGPWVDVEVTHVRAVAADGTVVAERDLP